MIETTTVLLMIVVIAAISAYNLYSNNRGMKKMGVRITNLELISTTLKNMSNNKPKNNTYNKKKKKYYRPKQSGTKKTTI